MKLSKEQSREVSIETGFLPRINWVKIARIKSMVLPVIVQDSETNEVLMLAYVNPKALMQSIKTHTATFWSTSRDEIWVKGETSGNTLKLNEVRINCEQDSFLFFVSRRKGGVCHVENKQGENYLSCFFRRIILNHLYLKEVRHI